MGTQIPKLHSIGHWRVRNCAFFKKKKAQRQASGCASGGWIGKHYQKCVHYSYILYTYLIHSTHRVCTVLFQKWVHSAHIQSTHQIQWLSKIPTVCFRRRTSPVRHMYPPPVTCILLTHVSSSCHLYPPDTRIHTYPPPGTRPVRRRTSPVRSLGHRAFAAVSGAGGARQPGTGTHTHSLSLSLYVCRVCSLSRFVLLCSLRAVGALQ